MRQRQQQTWPSPTVAASQVNHNLAWCDFRRYKEPRVCCLSASQSVACIQHLDKHQESLPLLNCQLHLIQNVWKMICFLACSKRIFCIDNITLICVCRKACVCTMSAQISSVVTDGQSDQPVLAHHIPLYLIFKEQFQLQECEHEMKHFCTVCRHIFLENCQCPLKKEGIFLCKRTCHHSPPPPFKFLFYPYIWAIYTCQTSQAEHG